MWRSLGVGLVLLVAVCVFAADLMPCPDCGEQVSERAVMCPHCGCPGEAIVSAAAAARTEEEAEQLPPPPFARVKSDSMGEGYAVGVAEQGKQYVVMWFWLLANAESLQIQAADGTDVDYRNLEIARNVPLARFQTSSTNLTYLIPTRTFDRATEEPIWIVPSEEDELGFIAVHGSSNKCPADPVARVNTSTNLVGVVYTVSDMEGMSAQYPPSTEWLPVKPGELRRQTRLLHEADGERRAGALSEAMRKQLQETEWLNPVMRDSAKTVLEVSQQQKEDEP